MQQRYNAKSNIICEPPLSGEEVRFSVTEGMKQVQQYKNSIINFLLLRLFHPLSRLRRQLPRRWSLPHNLKYSQASNLVFFNEHLVTVEEINGHLTVIRECCREYIIHYKYIIGLVSL